MRIKSLTQYRSVWMSVAILWIVLFHLPHPAPYSVFDFVALPGYCGVDIFVFASGLGCYSAYCRTPDPIAFMSRRSSKILPMFLTFMAVWLPYKLYFNDLTLNVALANLFSVQSLVNPNLGFNWYLSAMWIFYLLTPYFFAIVNKIRNKTQFFFVFLLVFAFTLSFWKDDALIILASRFPIFFLGMCLGHINNIDLSLNRVHAFFLGVFFVLGWILLFYFSARHLSDMWIHGLAWYPFILVTPGLCAGISYLCKIIHPTRIGSLIIRLFSFIGQHTFEIYLIHIFLFDIYLNNLIPSGVLPDRRLYWLFCLLLIIPCCFILHGLTALVILFQRRVRNLQR